MQTRKTARERTLTQTKRDLQVVLLKPTLISDSLCQFLGKPSGTEMARTEVTKYLTQYIKQHSLQDQANKRIINCDSALKGLLNVNAGDEVTYFNLQRYMKPHFPTSASNLASSS